MANGQKWNFIRFITPTCFEYFSKHKLLIKLVNNKAKRFILTT